MGFHTGWVQIHQHVNQFQRASSSSNPTLRSGHAHGPSLLAAWVELSIAGQIRLGVFMICTGLVIKGSNHFLLQLPSSSSMKKRETKALKTLASGYQSHRRYNTIQMVVQTSRDHRSEALESLFLISQSDFNPQNIH
ncbi:hypothetical protein V6N11_036230 [Hibiscus sabdariffa]|uniref:Uncharacterized protein n=1 Tax=Hibiscus sabdariffa TaxID=183260 RepID=A0ABR2R9Q5_9ROSI